VSDRTVRGWKNPSKVPCDKDIQNLSALRDAQFTTPFPNYLEMSFMEYEKARLSRRESVLKRFCELNEPVFRNLVYYVNESRLAPTSAEEIKIARASQLLGYLLCDLGSKFDKSTDTLVEGRALLSRAVALLKKNKDILGDLCGYYINRIRHSIFSSLYNQYETEMASFSEEPIVALHINELFLENIE